MSPRRRVTAVALAAAMVFAMFVALAGQGGPAGSAASAATAHFGPAKPKPHPKPKGPKGTYELSEFGPSDNDNAALQWSEQTLASIRAAAPPPTVGSRVLAIVQTSVYNAWAAYDPVAVGVGTGGTLPRPAG